MVAQLLGTTILRRYAHPSRPGRAQDCSKFAPHHLYQNASGQTFAHVIADHWSARGFRCVAASNHRFPGEMHHVVAKLPILRITTSHQEFSELGLLDYCPQRRTLLRRWHVSRNRNRGSKPPPLCLRQQARQATARRTRRTRGNS